MNEGEVLLKHYGELGVYTCEQLEAVGDIVAGRGEERVYAGSAEGKLRFYFPATGEIVELEPYTGEVTE